MTSQQDAFAFTLIHSLQDYTNNQRLVKNPCKTYQHKSSVREVLVPWAVVKHPCTICSACDLWQYTIKHTSLLESWIEKPFNKQPWFF